MFGRIRSRANILLHGDRFRREMDEEMEFHIECLTRDLIREGMDPKEASREARIRFGSAVRVRARSREERGLAFVDEVNRNVRFALRGMVRGPLLSGTFILTLALCIGFGTAVFSVVDSVLWRPLPYPNPDQLAHAVLYNPARGKQPGGGAVDGPTWERIRDEGQLFQRAVYSRWVQGVNLSTPEAAAFVQQQRVGAGYFETLGLFPAMGRGFEPAEDVPGGLPVAVLSHGLWSRTFLGDPDIIGSTIRLKGEAHTVVGVMSQDFRPHDPADVWTPLRAGRSGEGGGTNYEVLIRIPEGMSFAEAESRMASILPPESIQEGAPEHQFGLVPLEQVLTAGLRLPLLVLLGAVGLMLLVGCANLAGLQVARALTRRSEVATRQALGGGVGALVRQMVTENLLLGFFGGLVGLGVAYLAVDGLEGVVQAHFGTWQPIGMNGRGLLMALLLTVLSTILFGLAPVLQARKPDLRGALVGGSRGMMGGRSHLLRKTLLVGEVALVTVLLFAAGLLVRSYGHLSGLEPGFESEGVLTIQFSLDDARYAEAASVHRLFNESLAGIQQIPGVTSASVALTLPYERPLNLPFRLPGDDDGGDPRLTNAVYVSSGFFQTLGIPLLRGRTLEGVDREGAPLVAVANQAFMDENFQDGSGLGSTVQMGLGGGGGVEIVGVVGNVQQRAGWGGDGSPVWETPTLYLSAAQTDNAFFSMIHVWFSPSWIIRGSGTHADLALEVIRVFRNVDQDLPVARALSLRDVMNQAFARERFGATFLLVVAGFSLLLAGIGLYGLVAHEVMERRSEMGLRMALGATPGNAVWATGLSGLSLGLQGLVLGGGLALLTGRVLTSLIYGITPFDPVTLVALLGIVAVLTALASFVPAARVGRMDPAGILRER